MSAEGIMFHTGANLTNVVPHESGVLATVVAEGRTQQIFAHKILIATGRRPATEGLNLDAVNVSRGDRGEIIVDEHLRTSNPRIWAAGDVTGMAQLVYVASAQGDRGREQCSGQRASVPRLHRLAPRHFHVARDGCCRHDSYAG
nr:FAD-dependent oxidoreductase [Burkholderia cenocepacia]